MTVTIAMHFRAITAEDCLKGSVESVLDERNLEYPVPHVAGVFHADKKSGKQHEWANEKAAQNQSELNVQYGPC